MHRRTLLALPFLAALPARARPRHGISELRLGAPDPAAHARRLQAFVAIPTRAVVLQGPALVEALNAGHLEAAYLDPRALASARRRMGPRLAVLGPPGRHGTPVTRTVLSPSLQADLSNALA